MHKEAADLLHPFGFWRTWYNDCNRASAGQGYLPGQLYKLDSLYGNEAELKELLVALKEAGLVPVADIVINHRCADQQDEHGVWNHFGWGRCPEQGLRVAPMMLSRCMERSRRCCLI